VVEVAYLTGFDLRIFPRPIFFARAVEARVIVAESSPGTKGVLKHGTNALIAEFGNIMDLARKIEIIIKNDNLRNTIAIEARRELERKYSWAILKLRAQQIIENIERKI